MGSEMISYLQQLEILAFFSGFPLVYAIVKAIKGSNRSASFIKNDLWALLPFVYAVTGILFTSLQLRNWYPHYSYDHIASEVQAPFYASWALTSSLFFLPGLRKKPLLSLLHSLPFLFLLVRNYYLELSAGITDDAVLKNYMKVYLDSILLNIAVLLVLLIVYRITKYV